MITLEFYNNDGSNLLTKIETDIPIEATNIYCTFRKVYEVDYNISPYDCLIYITYIYEDRSFSREYVIKNVMLNNGVDVICNGFSITMNEHLQPQQRFEERDRLHYIDGVGKYFCVYEDVVFKRLKIKSNNTLYTYNFVDIRENKYLYAINIVQPQNRIHFYLRDIITLATSDIDQSYNFFSDKNPNLILVGLTTSPFSKNNILSNEHYGGFDGVDYDTIYPIYSYFTKEGEPPTIEMVCYKSVAEDMRVDKTDYISLSQNFNNTQRITFIDDCDIINPIIRLNTDGKNIDFNYVYISNINRYYYVANIVYVSNKIVELMLKIDILMTYKNSIYELYGFVDRNEFIHTPQIIDDKRVVYSGYDVDSVTVETALFKPQELDDTENAQATLYVTGFDIYGKAD